MDGITHQSFLIRLINSQNEESFMTHTAHAILIPQEIGMHCKQG